MFRNIPMDTASRTGARAAAAHAFAPLARMNAVPTGNSAKPAPAVTRKLGL